MKVDIKLPLCLWFPRGKHYFNLASLFCGGKKDPLLIPWSLPSLSLSSGRSRGDICTGLAEMVQGPAGPSWGRDNPLGSLDLCAGH